MTTHKIDNVEYTISAIPPYLQPYVRLYGDLAEKGTKNVTDAKQVEAQMKYIVEKVLTETVSPKPAKEHQFELYRIVNNLTSNAMSRADQFFPPIRLPQSNKKNGRVDSTPAKSKTK